MLTRGQVRVFTIGETRREITLYRFSRGESCILTVSCILSDRQFPAIALTHQQIAAELGSSREVVSRILADFAANGLVQVARGIVVVLDRCGLERRADLR